MQDDGHTPRRVASIEFSLSSPARHGWVEFRLVLGDEVFRLPASNVLNDPISELIDWVEFLLDPRSGFRRVCVWLEPEGYAFDLQPMRPSEFMVSVWWDGSFVPPMAGHRMDQRQRFLVNGDSLLRALSSGLREWVDDIGSGINGDWGDGAAYQRRLELLGFGSKR
ncbi:MAG TPA: hypothetical protein VN903_09330 [Polyangia bacterium]|jgi:hypothetical protein|nr:hypothetical protein [Polyangia bacterium]